MKLANRQRRKTNRIRWFLLDTQASLGAKEINSRVRKRMLDDQFLMMVGWRP